MSDGDDSIAMSIEDAFAQTLADMEDAREELASSPVESESSPLNSAFEVGVADVTEEVPEHNPAIAPPPSLTPVEAPQAPPMGGPPAGPPAGPPMMGPPMGGPPPGPPTDSPPAPPLDDMISEQEDHESTFQVADLSEITNDIQSVGESSTDLESNIEFDESVVVTESVEEEFETPEIPKEPEFNPVDADDFMSDFQDEWDNSAPARASDVDRTEGMDW